MDLFLKKQGKVGKKCAGMGSFAAGGSENNFGNVMRVA
jgi:hypothetical protein